jgi:hypothetical protein
VPLAAGVPKKILEGVRAADATASGSELAVALGDDQVRIEFPLGSVLCPAVRPTHLRVSPDGPSPELNRVTGLLGQRRYCSGPYCSLHTDAFNPL